MEGILQADIENRGIVIDPRTKLFYMLILCIFVIGGAGGYQMDWTQLLLCGIPFLLFLTAHQWRSFCLYSVLYLLLYFLNGQLVGGVSGAPRVLLAMFSMFILRLMPSLVMGAYIMGTTTVSEFIAAMERLHMPQQIVIPLAVMFRFFPTVLEEFRSINTAMRMRDIRFGGKNAGKMIEYRLIPLLVCSVTIGNELSAAALTRGLSVSGTRTNICKIGFHIQDAVLFIAGMLPVIRLILEKLGVMV